MNNLIKAQNVSLEYPIVGMGSRSLKNRVLSAATGGVISGGGKVPVVKALQKVSFEVASGDRVGLVGHNGAGKSSLLKAIAGIYAPTSGQLTVSGKAVSTLNLSLGLEPEATGIENIISRGLLLGLKKSEIEERIEDISEFSELGPYLDMPVRIYSSGMMTRLLFTTVTSLEAEILLMDELIGTGDSSFVEKAEKRLNSFMGRSNILVLASHSAEIIRKFCNKVVWLEQGEVVGFGAVDEILARYNQRGRSRTIL